MKSLAELLGIAKGLSSGPMGSVFSVYSGAFFAGIPPLLGFFGNITSCECLLRRINVTGSDAVDQLPRWCLLLC